MRRDRIDRPARLARVVVVDQLLIVVFAAIGRRNHDEGGGVTETLTVAAPFLIGYLLAAATLRLDRAPVDVRRALAVAVAGVGIGLVLRGVVFGRGLAPAFVVVAVITITALIVGWRLVATRLSGSRPGARS